MHKQLFISIMKPGRNVKLRFCGLWSSNFLVKLVFIALKEGIDKNLCWAEHKYKDV